MMGWGCRLRCCGRHGAALAGLRGPPSGRGGGGWSGAAGGGRAAAAGKICCPFLRPLVFRDSVSAPLWAPSRLLYSSGAACCYSKTNSETKYKDPFKLGSRDLKNLYEDIKKELLMTTQELQEMCEYYFDGKGKALRPMLVVLMARACNIHYNNCREVQPAQRSIAVIAEMIHTASLVHDDVIDGSDSRRGKKTVSRIWGERKAVLAGDYILSAASVALARIGNATVISALCQVIEDLVRGEFLQLGSKENENERFAHYLEKTFKKTASLIANSCKAVSILSCPDPAVHEIAYQYGKNIGIAFQLIDDVLDFTSCAAQLGKPTAADLKLGLATGPVLFACQQSDGVHQTTYLAQRYCSEAIREISKLQPSPERDALIQLTEAVLTRDK
ncbi:hypothetical protein GDO78_003260 [Eleutherodactylus coqui]|uniref:All trans-polyprenyl-diphosphate synthase PDSS1 n=1 Tax=Eleutherodactylus coqui TaxID=57060 RepID=A0A8J6EXE8_ELECQ|nr:hypothetical protein GDO78_003260 [Eleutherodactylus coqui]